MFNIKMTKNDIFYGCIKPIDIQHYFIKNLVEKNKTFIDYINTKDMLANNFTWTLDKAKVLNYRRKVGMIIIDSEDNQKKI